MTLVFDATNDPDLLDLRTWAWLRDNWWVCVFRGEEASPLRWCRSKLEPKPVANRLMHWRRPTYGEGCARVAWLRQHPADISYKVYRRDR